MEKEPEIKLYEMGESNISVSDTIKKEIEEGYFELETFYILQIQFRNLACKDTSNLTPTQFDKYTASLKRLNEMIENIGNKYKKSE